MKKATEDDCKQYKDIVATIPISSGELNELAMVFTMSTQGVTGIPLGVKLFADKLGLITFNQQLPPQEEHFNKIHDGGKTCLQEYLKI